MLKLSKTGWNNVIIFAVMGFILLINATNNMNSVDDNIDQSTAEIPLIGASNTILTLKVANVITIERVGTDWRAVPENISGQALEQMMMTWQNINAQTTSAPNIDRQFSLDVMLNVASSTQLLRMSFYASDQQLWVYKHATQQWLTMPVALYGQLFPQEIFITD